MRRRLLTAGLLVGGLCVAPSLAHAAGACAFSTLVAGPPKVIACVDTTATTWTVPTDWNHAGSGAKVEVIAGGGSGSWTGGSFAGGGGSGGCYSKASVGVDAFFTAGDSVAIQVGAGGTAATNATAGNVGTDSFVKDTGSTTRALAKAGLAGPFNTGVAAAACSTASGTGDTKNAGGIGGRGSGTTASSGGGGAGGPGGAGGAGAVASAGSGTGGGGGNGGGGNGVAGAAAVGGAGGTAQDATAGGAGGTGTLEGGSGSHGSGGGGAASTSSGGTNGGAGGNGIDWDSTHGSGGGSGGVGTASSAVGAAAGLYGGASGGCAFLCNVGTVLAPGAKGIIVVTYTPVVVSAHPRVME